MASAACKRRKVSAIPSSSSSSSSSNMNDENDGATVLCLSDLPIGILKHTATYLHLPSRILLSVALDDKDSSYSNDDNSSSSSSWNISQDEWNGILDFGQIEKSLAEKLTDNHIHSILMSLDAVNKVKTLRVTYCTNITGVGLEPLRGSIIIEHIDLQIIENHRSPTLDPDGSGHYISIPDNSLISCGHVLPIVNSIIDRGMERGCALKYLRLPHSFRDENHGWRLRGLDTTVARYKELMLNKRGRWNCSKCNKDLPHGDIELVETRGIFLEQKYTCSSCLNNFCYDCSDEDAIIYCPDEDHYGCVQSCAMCEMDYCIDCMRMNACGECNKSYCVGCIPFTHCSGCEYAVCDRCRPCYSRCCICKRVYCDDGMECSAKVTDCSGCKRSLCEDCTPFFHCCWGSDMQYGDCVFTAFCEACFRDENGIKQCRDCKQNHCEKCHESIDKESLEGLSCNGCIRMFAIALSGDNDKLRKEVKEECKKRWDESRELKNSIHSLNCGIRQLKVENEALKEKSEELKEEIKYQKDDIEDLEKTVERLEEEVKDLRKYRVI